MTSPTQLAEKNPILRTENRPRLGDDGNKPGRGKAGRPRRARIIVALSIMIGVLAGLRAGLITGINVAHRAGPAGAVAAGLIAEGWPRRRGQDLQPPPACTPSVPTPHPLPPPPPDPPPTLHTLLPPPH